MKKRDTVMAHSYIAGYYHCVFSTRNRRPLITPDVQERLWSYLGGIARENGMRALSVGGMDDHVHVLLSLPATISIAKAVQLIKGGSSKWLNDTFSPAERFRWQEGYGAFTVSISRLSKTIEYIGKQAEHHGRQTFEQEFIAFLERHRIEYERRYVFG